MRDLGELFDALRLNRFRSGIRLATADRQYLNARPPEVLRQHARNLIVERLAAAHPHNDGRQTPWRGHPVFSAQHATATCCRKCLANWHQIPRGGRLSDEEVEYVVHVIETWLAEYRDGATDFQPPRQRTLFDSKH